jgi:GNAT superfamily N-acetyltransferase
MTELINLANRGHRGVFPGDRMGPDSLRTQYADMLAMRGKAGERLVACGALRADEEALWIYILAVHPERRGEGLGAALIEEAERLAVERSKGWLKLQAVDAGSLIHYYLRLGFEEFYREVKPPGHWGARSSFDLVDLRRTVPAHIS